MVKNLIIQININTINYFSGMFKNSSSKLKDLSSNLSSNTPHKCYYPHTSHTITLSLFNAEFTTHLPSVCNNCVQSGIQITYFFFSFFYFFKILLFFSPSPLPPLPCIIKNILSLYLLSSL